MDSSSHTNGWQWSCNSSHLVGSIDCSTDNTKASVPVPGSRHVLDSCTNWTDTCCRGDRLKCKALRSCRDHDCCTDSANSSYWLMLVDVSSSSSFFVS